MSSQLHVSPPHCLSWFCRRIKQHQWTDGCATFHCWIGGSLSGRGRGQRVVRGQSLLLVVLFLFCFFLACCCTVLSCTVLSCTVLVHFDFIHVCLFRVFPFSLRARDVPSFFVFASLLVPLCFLVLVVAANIANTLLQQQRHPACNSSVASRNTAFHERHCGRQTVCAGQGT